MPEPGREQDLSGTHGQSAASRRLSRLDAAVAEYALGLFKEFGLDAHIENFEALIPYPTVAQRWR